MAIAGRRNVVEMVRAAKCPYWKLYENESKKQAGNFVASADFENKSLGLDASCDALTTSLSMLGAGRYIITAYSESGQSKKGIDSYVELEQQNYNGSPIAGIGAIDKPSTVYVEGVGNVNPENIGEAIDKKIALLFKKQKEEAELQALRDRIKTLEAENRENNSALQRGMMSIGTIAYPILSKTPAFKEVLGVVSGFLKQTNGEASSSLNTQNTPTTNADMLGTTHAEHVDGDMAEIGGQKVNQDRLFHALDKLAANNPDVLAHLEGIANLKENDPDTYQAGLDFMKAN